MTTEKIENQLVEAGTLFTVTHVELGIGNNATHPMLIRTASKAPHFVSIEVIGTQAVHFELYTGSTLTDIGTLLTTNVPKDLNTERVPTTEIYDDTVVSVNGDLFYEKLFEAGGSGGQDLVGVGLLVLKPNVDYLLLITNLANTSMDLGLQGDYYE